MSERSSSSAAPLASNMEVDIDSFRTAMRELAGGFAVVELPQRVREMMRVRSLVTLGIFSTAAVVALRFPIGGMALICICLAVYVRPEAPTITT